jgi:ATP-binding cassette, subfamily B, bacterial MsbA
MKSILKIIRYIEPYKWQAVISIGFVIFSSFFSLFSLAMVAPFLNVLFENSELVTEPVQFRLSTDSIIHNFNYFLSQLIVNKGKVHAMYFVGIMVVVMTLLKNVFLYLSKYFMIPIRTGVVRDIRNQVYRKVLGLPLGYFTDERKGDMMTRMAQDVQEIESSVVRSLEMLFRDPIQILIFLASLFYLSFQLTLFVMVLLPISGFIIGRIGRSLRSTSLAGQKKLSIIMSVFEETLGGLRIIKSFNAEEKMRRRFENANLLFTKLTERVYQRQQLASPLSEFLGVFVLIIILWFGGSMVLTEGSLTSSVLITYLVIFSQIINPAKSVTTAYYNVLKGLASSDRIDEVINADIRIREKGDAKKVSEFRNDIQFRDVHFKYNQDFVLREINLTIKKGQTIALVGRSGSGKSTLVDLIPRFIDATEGDVLLDGISVRDFTLFDLRQLMGIVSQQSILFNDSFYNNIAFGLESSTEAEVIAAAKVANAHEFIIESQHGYYTNVGEGGSKLSGGQRQRISIARAVLKNPPILILDEATSSLDTESERLVQEAIVNLMKNRTSIVIAHRLSTIKHADLIVVIEDGRVVESGRHDELVNNMTGTYRKLHDLQMF